MMKSFARRLRDRAVVTGSILTLAGVQGALAEQLAPNDENTATPIHHLIVIVGENRTFDHVFATYASPSGEKVLNLLSEGVVNTKGELTKKFLAGKVTLPFGQATQNFVPNGGDTSGGTSSEGTYTINPTGKTPYPTLPPPGAAGSPNLPDDGPYGPPFQTVQYAANFEYGLLPGDLYLITTGYSNLSQLGSLSPYHQPDTRIPNDFTLANGPFWLHGPKLPYDSYTGSPVHRFYQMWQETDCSASAKGVTSCLSDLFPFVETTISAGTNGSIPAHDYDLTTGAESPYTPTNGLTGYQNPEGATAMGYYNMAQGDAPYFKSLADNYTIGDNNHQGVEGGTGANHIMIGYADAIWYSNESAATPSASPATPPSGEIEDPNPAAGTNNIYAEDGYGANVSPPQGGTYTDCYDSPVAAVQAYLTAAGVNPNCQAGGYYYLLNNYNPGFVGNGTQDPDVTGAYTIPPLPPSATPATAAPPVPHIGDMLDASGVSWAYFGESWNDYVQDPNGETNPAGYLYCNICNPYQYSSSTMTGQIVFPAEYAPITQDVRDLHLFDTTDLYNDLATGNLPAVSIVKPSALNDGHPASSKLDLFESFTHKIIKELKANPTLWKDTAVIITWDEGGGYWDSGYIQPIDYFGDGTRIPLIAVSRFATGGHVVHTYYDHASIAKFVEANWAPAIAAGVTAQVTAGTWYVPGMSQWTQTNKNNSGLMALSSRSRDNLPNPVTAKGSPYVPTNGPAIGNLMDLFHFRAAAEAKKPKD